MPEKPGKPGLSQNKLVQPETRKYSYPSKRCTHAYDASGLKEILDATGDPDNSGADLGYVGVEGIRIVPFRKPSGGELLEWQREFNANYSKIRATVEHAVAKVKTWRMLSEEGGRYRCPIDKYASMLAAVTGLFFFAEYGNG